MEQIVAFHVPALTKPPPTHTLSPYNPLRQLIKEREALEIEAEGIRSFVSLHTPRSMPRIPPTPHNPTLPMIHPPTTSQLLAPGPNGAPPPGLRGTSLVDDEGFPRADIDVYDVRSKRHRLACIDTDYELLMKRIEELVKRIHEEARAAASVRPPSVATSTTQPSTAAAPAAVVGMEVEKEGAAAAAEAEAAGLAPFALIDQVFQQSPAAEAGVKEGDLLLKFGSVDHGNHDGFRAVVGVVNDSVGRAVRVLVRRKEGAVALMLTPHTWSGRGLLGCHLSPLAS